MNQVSSHQPLNHSPPAVITQQSPTERIGIVGFNVPLTNTLQVILGRFYGSDDPTNSVTALTDNGQSTVSRANFHHPQLN